MPDREMPHGWDLDDPALLEAFERLLAAHPPYPKGTVVREMQDAVAAWHSGKSRPEEIND